jgi:hypothetical protein
MCLPLAPVVCCHWPQPEAAAAGATTIDLTSISAYCILHSTNSASKSAKLQLPPLLLLLLLQLY